MLTAVGARYSQTECKNLAIWWACEKFYHYVYGVDFTEVTGQKSLLGIFNKVIVKPMARIERKLCVQPYYFKLVYKPRLENKADFQSRHPVNSPHSGGQ